MQVESKTKVFANQNSDFVFTYDNEVMERLAGVPYSRFSVKTKDPEKLLDGLCVQLVFKEKVNGDIVSYYYSPILEKYVCINGKKINLQVCKSDDITTIGYPMIDVGF